MTKLSHPLTRSMLMALFGKDLSVSRDAVALYKRTPGVEATVAGEWSFSRLAKLLKSHGFAQVGGKDSVYFANEDKTVGVICRGEVPDPKSPRWKFYSLEVMSRSKRLAKQDTR